MRRTTQTHREQASTICNVLMCWHAFLFYHPCQIQLDDSLESGNPGTWKSGIQQIKKIQIKIRVGQNVGKVWIITKKKQLPTQFGPMSAKFFHGPDTRSWYQGSWYQDLGTKILVPRSWYQDLWGNQSGTLERFPRGERSLRDCPRADKR